MERAAHSRGNVIVDVIVREKDCLVISDQKNI